MQFALRGITQRPFLCVYIYVVNSCLILEEQIIIITIFIKLITINDMNSANVCICAFLMKFFSFMSIKYFTISASLLMTYIYDFV